MTDKVQKIREEVERIHNLLPVMDSDNISVNYADRICTTLEMYIDSLQEESEPKFKVGDTIRHKETGDVLYIDIVDDEGYHQNSDFSYAPIEDQDQWELVKEPKKCMFTQDHYTDEDRKVLCEDCDEDCEYAKKDLKERYKRIAQSESFKEAYDGKSISEEEPSIPEVVDKHWWELLGEEPVSEELEKVADQYSQGIESDYINDMFDRGDIYEAVIYGAQWQKQQDQSTIELAEDHAMLAGMEKMKEQMMSKAVDGEVGYWNQRGLSVLMELPRELEEDDKCKVIIIKED